MKKVKTINFLKEKKKKDKVFILTFLVLVYLLIFQGTSYMKSIKILEDEINQMKINMETKKENNHEIKKSALLDNTKEVYDLLGSSNVQRIYINNGKVEIEAKCKDLEVLDELKEIRTISVSNIEKKKNNYIFKAVYEIGGVN